jgi:hypothetical protein
MHDMSMDLTATSIKSLCSTLFSLYHSFGLPFHLLAQRVSLFSDRREFVTRPSVSNAANRSTDPQYADYTACSITDHSLLQPILHSSSHALNVKTKRVTLPLTWNKDATLSAAFARHRHVCGRQCSPGHASPTTRCTLPHA